MTNEPKTTDVAATPTNSSASLLTKAGIALLFLSVNPAAEQSPKTPPSFHIIVVGGTDAEVDDLELTQRCNQCEAAVVLHLELEQKETDR